MRATGETESEANRDAPLQGSTPEAAAARAAGDSLDHDSRTLAAATLSASAAAPTPPKVQPRSVTSGRFRDGFITVMQSLSLDERLGRIILSLVLAALLWFYVTSLENPAQTTTFTNLSVEMRDLGSELKVISGSPASVNVAVQAPQNIMSTLRQGDIRPYVELRELGAGVHEVPVMLDVNGAFSPGLVNTTVSPRTVQVQLEVQASRTYTVAVKMQGTPAFGFGTEPAQVTPSQVRVTGAEDAINRIAQVIVTVDVDSKASTQQGFKTPVALDASGQIVSGVTFQPSDVQVVVPVKLLLSYKVVPVKVTVTGNPAAGYSVSQISPDPTNVTICCAPQDVLDPVQSLDTLPVAISGTTSTVITTTQLILPTGIDLYPGQSREISVTISVETFETSWQLSVVPSVEGVPPGTSAVLSPGSIELTLAGTFAQFQALQPADVRAVVNAEGRSPGTYDLTPQVVVPQGIRVAAVNPSTVTLSVIAPTPVPPTSTPIPTATSVPTPQPSASATAGLPVGVPTAAPAVPSATHSPAPGAPTTVTATPVTGPAPSPTLSPTPAIGPDGLPQPTPLLGGAPTPTAIGAP